MKRVKDRENQKTDATLIYKQLNIVSILGSFFDEH